MVLVLVLRIAELPVVDVWLLQVGQRTGEIDQPCMIAPATVAAAAATATTPVCPRRR